MPLTVFLSQPLKNTPTDAAPTITDSDEGGSFTLAPSEREPGFPQSGRPLEASSWKHQILICHLQSSDWCCAAAMVDLLDHWSSASVIAEFLVASRLTSLTAVSPGSSNLLPQRSLWRPRALGNLQSLSSHQVEKQLKRVPEK